MKTGRFGIGAMSPVTRAALNQVVKLGFELYSETLNPEKKVETSYPKHTVLIRDNGRFP